MRGECGNRNFNQIEKKRSTHQSSLFLLSSSASYPASVLQEESFGGGGEWLWDTKVTGNSQYLKVSNSVQQGNTSVGMCHTTSHQRGPGLALTCSFKTPMAPNKLISSKKRSKNRSMLGNSQFVILVDLPICLCCALNRLTKNPSVDPMKPSNY